MGSTDFFHSSCNDYLRQRDALSALPPPHADKCDDTATEQAAERLQQQLRAQRYLRHLCVHLDSPEPQCWPLQAVADGLCRVLSQHDEACVLVLGQRDQLPRCACHAQRVMFLAHYSPAAMASVVARSAAIVGADCAMLKVAGQHGVPGVALFANAGDAARRGQDQGQGRHWSPFDSIVLDQHGIDVAQRVARALQRGLFA